MKKFQTGIALLLCVSMLCLTSCSKTDNNEIGPNPFSTSPANELVETPGMAYQTEMLSLINEVRSYESDCGGQVIAPSAEVRWDSRLYAAALGHANSMNDKSFFSHEGADGSTVAERVEREGYVWKTVGENIAFDFADVPTVNTGFENSPTHCKVMNNAAYTEVGVANVGKYWVVVFGSPF